MQEHDSFDTALNSYETVRLTIDSLKAEYITVCDQIAKTQAALAAAPLLRIPLNDLKDSILDFIDACGERYAADQIKTAVSNFARNIHNVSANDQKLAGLPLRYCDIERAISGGHLDYATQFATPSKSQFDDRALYFLFAPLLKERLRALMNTMKPEEFGYAAIHPDKIGSDRKTRKAEIDSLSDRLTQLNEQRDSLLEKLAKLGVNTQNLHTNKLAFKPV